MCLVKAKDKKGYNYMIPFLENSKKLKLKYRDIKEMIGYLGMKKGKKMQEEEL